MVKLQLWHTMSLWFSGFAIVSLYEKDFHDRGCHTVPIWDGTQIMSTDQDNVFLIYFLLCSKGP